MLKHLSSYSKIENRFLTRNSGIAGFKNKLILQNDRGMAVFEIIPIIIVIVIFVNFSLGFFGAIHTGVLGSISARNYAFETFRNRANLVYFRNVDMPNANDNVVYQKDNLRFHGSKSEKQKNDSWTGASRLIDFTNFGTRTSIIGKDKANHAKIQGLADGRNNKLSANPILIKTAYGICLNPTCGR